MLTLNRLRLEQTTVFKTFIFGIVLGVVGTIVAVLFVPVVDQARENSVITVATNGGSAEAFYINIPTDRIVVGAPGDAPKLPSGLAWPDELSAASADMYKLRNVHNAVIGVASRVVLTDVEQGDVVEWVLHMPARGSLYIGMDVDNIEGGARLGTLHRGTREFSKTQGAFSERWVAADSDDEVNRGRIELVSRFVSIQQPASVTE